MSNKRRPEGTKSSAAVDDWRRRGDCGASGWRFLFVLTKRLRWPRITDCGMDIGCRQSICHTAPYLQAPFRISPFGYTGCFARSIVRRFLALSTRRRAPNHLHGCITEADWHCHTVWGIGSRRRSFNTDSTCIVILGACKLRTQTYCLLQREAIYQESTATRATPKHSLTAPNPRMICVSDELLRPHYSTSYWVAYGAPDPRTRPARRTFRRKSKRSAVWKTFPPFIVHRREGM